MFVNDQLLPLDSSALETFCQKWQVKELALFGSVARGDARPNSDVDVMVTFYEGARLAYGTSCV